MSDGIRHEMNILVGEQNFAHGYFIFFNLNNSFYNNKVMKYVA